MRKGGKAEISRLVITSLTKGLGSGTSSEIGAILTDNFRADLLTIGHRATTDILTTAARQGLEMTKIDQAVISMVTAISTHTTVINLV